MGKPCSAKQSPGVNHRGGRRLPECAIVRCVFYAGFLIGSIRLKEFPMADFDGFAEDGRLSPEETPTYEVVGGMPVGDMIASIASYDEFRQCVAEIRSIWLDSMDTEPQHPEEALIARGREIGLKDRDIYRMVGDMHSRGDRPASLEESQRANHAGFTGFVSSASFVAAYSPPHYVVDGVVISGKILTLTGKTGHGKTITAIKLAIDVAAGRFFCGRKCRKGHVAFVAAENPDNVRMQFMAQCEDMGLDPGSLDISWHEGAFSLANASPTIREELAWYPETTLVIFDSLQALFDGDDSNSNNQMLRTAIAFRDLVKSHANKPAGIILSHPIKNATKSDLTPYGGGALLNELDGNLTQWNEGGIAELHHQGKFRGAPFDPITLELAVIESDSVRDLENEKLRMTVVRPMGEQRRAEVATDAMKRRILILTAIRDKPGIIQAELVGATGISKSSVARYVTELTQAKAIKSRGGKLKLTPEGEKWFD
ncbi:hypothetical protein B9J07_13610 [Sinorhizobium sp. LM21]|nr:hypothetical protein B9J07_13610 [Sinorhizobium sp. LM21]